MRHIIFHIDVNSAYLSWTAIEYLKRGEEDLRGIPCIIGGDKKSRHGVVLAKSIPAKHTGSAPENRSYRRSENVRCFGWNRRTTRCTPGTAKD